MSKLWRDLAMRKQEFLDLIGTNNECRIFCCDNHQWRSRKRGIRYRIVVLIPLADGSGKYKERTVQQAYRRTQALEHLARYRHWLTQSGRGWPETHTTTKVVCQRAGAVLRAVKGQMIRDVQCNKCGCAVSPKDELASSESGWCVMGHKVRIRELLFA